MEEIHTSILIVKVLKIVIPIAIVLAVFVIKLVSNRNQKRIVCYEDEQAYTAAEGENEPQNQYCDDEEDDYDPEKEKAESRKNIEKFTKQLESAQTNERKAELYCCRSQAYSSLDMYSQATEDINAAIALCPQNDYYYYKRAVLLFQQGDDDAVQDIATAIFLAPKNGNYYNFRAAVYLTNPENFEKAMQDCTTVLGLFESNMNISASEAAEAYFVRGRIYFYLKQYAKALENATKAIELKQDVHNSLALYDKVAFYILRARTYCAIGNYAAAIEDYNFLAEKDKYKREQWIFERAEAYLKNGDKEKAREEFLCVIALPAFDNLRAGAFRAIGEYSKALNTFKESIDYYKKIAEEPTINIVNNKLSIVHFLIGDVYKELKEYDKALEDYKMSIEYYKKAFARNKSELDIYDHIRYNNCLNRIAEITGNKIN